MADVSIYEKLTPLLRAVFDDDDLVATPDLTAHKVNGWDSLGNIRLFLEIEKAFTLRFSAAEMTSLKNVAELAQLIARKLTTRPFS